jgi:hypothetical protein
VSGDPFYLLGLYFGVIFELTQYLRRLGEFFFKLRSRQTNKLLISTRIPDAATFRRRSIEAARFDDLGSRRRCGVPIRSFGQAVLTAKRSSAR